MKTQSIKLGVGKQHTCPEKSSGMPESPWRKGWRQPTDKDKGPLSPDCPTLKGAGCSPRSRLPGHPPPHPHALNLARVVEQLGRELLELEELGPRRTPPRLTFQNSNAGPGQRRTAESRRSPAAGSQPSAVCWGPSPWTSCVLSMVPPQSCP